MFCRELVADLRRTAEQDDDLPEVVFVFQGGLDQGREIIHGLWPEARAVSDSELALYHAFGLGRGSLGQLFGPSVWAAGLRAARKGHSIGKPVGDPWIMPGLFLIADEHIVWSHDFRHAGDHPDLTDIARRTAELGARAS